MPHRQKKTGRTPEKTGAVGLFISRKPQASYEVPKRLLPVRHPTTAVDSACQGMGRLISFSSLPPLPRQRKAGSPPVQATAGACYFPLSPSTLENHPLKTPLCKRNRGLPSSGCPLSDRTFFCGHAEHVSKRTNRCITTGNMLQYGMRNGLFWTLRADSLNQGSHG